MSTPDKEPIPADIMKWIGQKTAEHMEREFSAAMNNLSIPRSMEWVRVHEAYQESAIAIYRHLSCQHKAAPGMRVKNNSGKAFEVHKYIKDAEGVEHIWCNQWYGHHGIGHDCEWASEETPAVHPSAGLRWVKASERLPAKCGEQNKVFIDWNGIPARGYRNYDKENPQMYFDLGYKSVLTNEGVKWLEETPNCYPEGGGEGEGNPFGLSETEVKQLLACTLKSDEIAGEAPIQQDRIREVVRWFVKYAMGGGNPKWFQGHAFELAYYIATNSGNRFIDLEAIRQAAFKEGVNISPAERSLLSKIPDFIATPATEAQPIADGKEVPEEIAQWIKAESAAFTDSDRPSIQVGMELMYHKMQEEMEQVVENAYAFNRLSVQQANELLAARNKNNDDAIEIARLQAELKGCQENLTAMIEVDLQKSKRLDEVEKEAGDYKDALKIQMDFLWRRDYRPEAHEIKKLLERYHTK